MAEFWQEAVDLKVYVSTAGDFVSLGNRSEYPFVAGGSGFPAGWVMFNSAGTSPSDVNFTTQGGRFSISNAMPTVNAGRFYGVYRDFPVTPGKFYLFQLQARQMEGMTTTQRNIRFEWSNGVGSGAFGNAETDWEQVSIPCGQAPAGVTFLRIVIQGVYYWGSSAGPGVDPEPQLNWGVQFQNVSVIEQDASYMEPTWDEVTCEVRNLDLRYGRDRFTSRYDVASMTLSVNNDSGYFTYDPMETLRPGRFIKVEGQQTRWTGGPYDQFYGLIDSLSDSFTLDGHAVTTIQAVDISSLLSNTTVPTASWNSSTFLSGARFRRLLDAVGWHPTMRSTMPGVFVQQPVLANGRSVRDELGLIADSEGGYFYADRSGNVVYQDRSWNPVNNRAVNAELMAQPVELVTPIVPTVKFGFNRVRGNYMTVPFGAQMNPVGGGIDIQVHCAVNDWSAPSLQHFVARFEAAPFSWKFRKHNVGRGFLTFFVNGLGSARTSTEGVPYANGERCWLRVTREDATGIVRFWHAPDMPTVPSMSQWVKLGDDVTSTPGALLANTGGMTIGADAGGWDALDGYIWSVRVRDGVNVTGTVTHVDVSHAYDRMGATSFPITIPAVTVAVAQVAPFQVIQPDPTEGEPGLPVVDDVPNVGATVPIICLNELQTTWSRDRVVNEVSLANQGGSAITTVDAESQRRYGPRTYQRMDFLNVNTDESYLRTRTQDIMDGYTDSILRVNSVRFRPDRDAAGFVYWFTLRVWLNWLVRVRYTHPRNGWGFSVVSHVQGIEHTFTLTGWEVTLFLDDPEAFNYWDEATGAGWDISEWDTDLWDARRADEVYWSSGQKWSEGHRWG